MKEEIVNQLQHAASGKAAMSVAVVTVTLEEIVRFLTVSEGMHAILVTLGLIVSVSIIAVNYYAMKRHIAAVSLDKEKEERARRIDELREEALIRQRDKE